MDLFIQRYCRLLPERLTTDGKLISEFSAQETPEKSLLETYRTTGLNYVKFFKMDNLSKLAVLAAESVLKDTALYHVASNDSVAVVLTNSSSSLVADTNYQRTIEDNKNYFPSPSLFVYTLPNIAIGEICIKHRIYGENLFMISQKFDSRLLNFHVNSLFENSDTQYCIAGWVECNEKSYEAFMLLVGKKASNNKFDFETINELYNNK
jgi:hypothetical protein